jgi:Zn-dependent metalloprotease
MTRRTYARLDDAGRDGLGLARARPHAGSTSWFNRITRTAMVGTGGGREIAEPRLTALETTAHELSHAWFDRRAGFGGLVYAFGPGRVSEGLAQVMAGASLALEGADERERAYGWRVLDPRGRTTPIGRREHPLSVTMDDVAARRATLTDNGLVHVHSGVVQEGHLRIARALGMEPMARLTVDAAHAELTPLTGIRRWAGATVRTAERTWGARSGEAAAVREAWQAARVVLPG